jgi:hypothetical protein
VTTAAEALRTNFGDTGERAAADPAKVAGDGSGTIQLYDVRHGQFAPGYRQLAETPGMFERYMKEHAAKRFDGAVLEKLELAPPDEPGPMWMKSTMKVPGLATQSGLRSRLAPSVTETSRILPLRCPVTESPPCLHI